MLVDVNQIAKDNDIRIVENSNLCLDHRIDVVRDEGGWVAEIPATSIETEKRLLVARAIGIVLSSKVTGSNCVAYEGRKAEYDFAKCLLMPAFALSSCAKQGLSFVQTSQLLGVTETAVRWRTAELGM